MEEPISDSEVEADSMLEAPARCPQYRMAIDELQVFRILRPKMNLVSSLPRRGQIMICPKCHSILTGSLGGLI